MKRLLNLTTMKGIGVILGMLALMLAVFSGQPTAQAQNLELLQNGNFTSYYGIGVGDSVVPTGWTLRVEGAYRSAQQKWVFNEFPGFTASWQVSSSYTPFTMYGYQFVPGVRSGTPLRFSAYANLYTCNRADSCIGSGGTRSSDTSSGARVRIGVDPTGGQDPASANVVWSQFSSPFDRFQQLVVDVQSKNDNGVTVFLHATQAAGMLLNHVYWDKASLQSLGPGSPFAPPASPTPAGVPFVTPQGTQTDGSVYHIVAQGDTLASIAVAYKVSIDEIRKLNNIPADEYVIRPGQKLLIKGPSLAVTYIIVTATPTPDGTTTPSVTPTNTRAFNAIATNTRIPLAVTIITLPSATPRP